MLLLIYSHRHNVCLIEQDVRRHQHRVSEKPGVDIVRMLGRLVLELGHPVQLAHVGKAVQDPGQLRVSGHMRLVVDTVLLRIQTGRDVEDEERSGSLPQSRRVLAHSDRVHVHHAVEALVLVTQCDPVLQCSQIVSKGQVSCRLHPAE